MKQFFLIFLSLLCLNLKAQEKLNRLDSAGKKDGTWVLYYNQNFKVVDSAKAAYYCYEYYYHGNRMYTHAKLMHEGWTVSDSTNVHKTYGNAKLLDGKYTWYWNKNQVAEVHYYANGYLVWSKDYYKNGQLYLYCDYTDLCDGYPHTSHWYVYKKDGTFDQNIPVGRFRGCI